jgi:hypothetical protein
MKGGQTLGLVFARHFVAYPGQPLPSHVELGWEANSLRIGPRRPGQPVSRRIIEALSSGLRRTLHHMG